MIQQEYSQLFVRIILLLIVINGIGCSPRELFLNDKSGKQTSQKSIELGAPEKKLKVDQANFESFDPRLKKISLSPSLLAAQKNIFSAQKNVQSIRSQKETQINSSSNLGPRLDDESLKLEATTGLTLTKLISDGGEIDAVVSVAELNVIASQLTYLQTFNKQLAEVIRAEQTIVNYRKAKSIYEEQLSVYTENLPLIESAVKANVIPKTDALKLEQLKLKSEEAYLSAKTASQTAKLIRNKYNLTDTDKFFELDLNKWKSFEKKKNKTNFTKIEAINTQIKILEEDIKSIKSAEKANVSFAANATANVSNFNNSLGFLGLNISLPVKDGGKKQFDIQGKELQIASLEKQREEALLLNNSSFKALLNFEEIYYLRADLLEAQTGNSQTIYQDMELKLRAGAASVVDLAMEKMNFYDLRSQKNSLEYQKINQIINFYDTLGDECSLTELCDQVKLFQPSG